MGDFEIENLQTYKRNFFFFVYSIIKYQQVIELITYLYDRRIDYNLNFRIET